MRRRYSSTMRRSFSPPCTQQYTPIALGDDIQGVKDGGEGRKHIVQDKASAGQALLHSLGHGGGMIKIAVAHQLGDVGVHAGLPRQPLPGRISWTKDTKNRQPACMVGWQFFVCVFSAGRSFSCCCGLPQSPAATAIRNLNRREQARLFRLIRSAHYLSPLATRASLTSRREPFGVLPLLQKPDKQLKRM